MRIVSAVFSSDFLIYLGAGGMTLLTKFQLGDLSKFQWWQLIFIGFFILFFSIVGGLLGGFISMGIKESILKKKKSWTGKKKELNIPTWV